MTQRISNDSLGAIIHDMQSRIVELERKATLLGWKTDDSTVVVDDDLILRVPENGIGPDQLSSEVDLSIPDGELDFIKASTEFISHFLIFKDGAASGFEISIGLTSVTVPSSPNPQTFLIDLSESWENSHLIFDVQAEPLTTLNGFYYIGSYPISGSQGAINIINSSSSQTVAFRWISIGN